jgi:hypothetical protein
MVIEEGQLYTIEGIAASVLILTTVYLVLSTTSLYTPGETHIYDMQLTQLGNDVLAVMDMNATWNTTSSPYPKSPLEYDIENNKPDEFKQMFLFYGNQTTGKMDNLQFNARIIYRKTTVNPPEIMEKYFSSSSGYDGNYNRENAVTVTRWVNVDNTSGSAIGLGLDQRNQTVLLEVLLWRG